MDHKAKSLIIASGVFLGLLLPLRLPEFFWPIALSVAALSSLSVFWVFGEKPNFTRLKEDWFAIVFLFVFVMALGVFAYTLPHPLFQALILGTTGFFVYYILQVASRIKRNYTPSFFLRNVIAMASILALFFAASDVSKWMMSSQSSAVQVGAIALIFVVTFIICEFMFEIQGYDRPVLYSLIIAFLISQIMMISSFWIITYPQTKEATNIGIPLPAVFAAVYFYFFWGVSHHRLEGTLTRKILWEYTFIGLLFMLVLIFTANWMPHNI
jgi:hypothetical protein